MNPAHLRTFLAVQKHLNYTRAGEELFISQPAVFFKRAFLEEIGPIDESLHFAMDYELWLRMPGLTT